MGQGADQRWSTRMEKKINFLLHLVFYVNGLQINRLLYLANNKRQLWPTCSFPSVTVDLRTRLRLLPIALVVPRANSRHIELDFAYTKLCKWTSPDRDECDMAGKDSDKDNSTRQARERTAGCNSAPRKVTCSAGKNQQSCWQVLIGLTV